MTITDFLGFFGAITGFASLAMHFDKYLKARPKIKIIFTDIKANLSFKSDVSQDGYLHKGRCIIYIRLENLSSNPITVTEFSLTPLNSEKETFISNTVTKAKGIYEILRWAESPVDKYSFTIPIEDDQLLPPIEIPPYGVRSGCIFFVTSEPKSFRGEFAVVTPVKVFKTFTDVNLPTPISKFHTKVNTLPSKKQ